MAIIFWILAGLVGLYLGFVALALIIGGVANSPSTHNAVAIDAKKSNQYHIKKGRVVFVSQGNFFSLGEQEIDGADTDSFSVLDNYFAKDKHHVYYNGKIIPQLDPNNVTIIEPSTLEPKPSKYPSSGYIKTDQHVYLGDHIIEGADPKTFQALWGVYGFDAHNIYYYDTKKFPTKGQVSLLTPSHKDHRFWQTSYLRTGNSIYYQGILLSNDADNFEFINDDYTKDSTTVFYQGSPLEGVTSRQFKLLSNYFRVDENNAYYFTKLIPNADPKSFTALHDNFAKDNQHVYYETRIVDNANPKEWSASYAKERSKMWLWQPLIINEQQVIIVPDGATVDLATGYKSYQGGVYDSRHGLIKDITPNDVKPYPNSDDRYVQLKNQVYFCTQLIPEADAATFEVINEPFSKDKQFVFWHQYKLINLAPDGFAPQDHYYGKENEQGEYELVTTANPFE